MSAKRTGFVLPAVVSSLLLFSPGSGLSQEKRELPEQYRRWLQEEVVYIISKVERGTFLDLKTEEEREAFIETFWRRRDTNPSTLENEYRDEHYKRIAYVNEFFGRDTFRPGWMTDRGRYYILLGPPTDIQNFEAQDAIYPAELWFYNRPELQQYGLPPFFYLLFFRRHGAGELELYSPGTDGPQELLTGYQTMSRDFRKDVEDAYNKLWEISPELAQASLSFRTDEGDTVEFQAPAFGTLALLDQIAQSPLRGVDTSYAERFYVEKGTIESDYLFSYVPSWVETAVLPGPGHVHYLHWVIEIDPQSLALVKDEEQGLYGSLFIISAEVVPRDAPDKLLLQLRKESFMRLSESQVRVGSRLPFAYSGMFPLAPGSYQVRIILRNRACTGREEATCRKSYTILDSAVDVPGWDREGPHLSQVVLGYGTEPAPGDPVYRPYRFGNLQVLPNPRRVYAAGETLVAMTEPLNAGSGFTLRYRISNRDLPDQLQAEKTVPLDTLRLEPMVEHLSLEGFSGGRYQLIVDLLDSASRVVDSKTEEFDVSPRTAVARPSLRASWPLVSPEVPGVVDMALGEQYLSVEDGAKARELFEAALRVNPRFGAAREALARICLKEGASDRVIELLAPIYESVPDRYEVVALLGEARFQKKEYAKAAEMLEKAIALRRPDARVLKMLGVSQMELGNPARALELFDRSLALNPDQPEVHELVKKLRTQ